ncbi:MAG: peptidoglycan-associated lipoprotein Pal [Gammaproteobacteria bacterium]
MDLFRIVVVTALLGLVVACGGKSGTAMEDGVGQDGYGGSDSGASSSGVDDGGFAQGGAFGSGADGGPSGLDNRVIYFAFDQSDVDPDSIAVLEEHGAYLAGRTAVSVRLEGHADERGSREYNIGLGERRAQAVRRILLLQGVVASQLSTVSYGEERPAVLGSDEEAWGLNRRVELVYAD